MQCENKTRQQPSVALATRKRRRTVSSTENLSEIKVENVGNNFKLEIDNPNLNSTNDEQLNSIQTTVKGNVLLTKYNCLIEDKYLEVKNEENDVPVTETETIYVKQEPQFSEDDTTTNSLDKQIKDSKDTETIYIKQEPQFSEDDSTSLHEDSEGSNSSNEDDPDFEMSEEETSRPNATNKQKITVIPLKPCYVSHVKFCNTCQELLFKDLNNINLHLYTHIQSSNCSRCEDSLKEINTFQRHMFNHCETMVEVIDKGEHGEKFSCALCDQQFDEFSNLKNHISDKHIRSLKCVVCSTAFTHKANLVRHILVTHCHVKLYKCKLCPTRFTSKESANDHVIYQHYSDKICICKYCHQTFRKPKNLREHISKYHEEDARQEEEKRLTYDSSKNSDAVEILSCPICREQFNDVNNLKKHLYDNHLNSLVCEICFKTYTYRGSKVKHIIETHCRVKLYNCKICVKKFICKLNCDNHMIRKHNNGNAGTEQVNKVIVTGNHDNFSCEICGIQFDDFEKSIKHIYDKHMPDLNCVVCSASFTRRIILHRHILKKHCDFKLFKSTICSKQFTNEESIKKHMNRKHNDGNTTVEPENKVPVTLENGQKVTCTICHKQFDVFENLRRHIYDDHITDLDCVVCSKTSTRKTTLNRHILEVHCDLKIINCILCPQKFVCKRIFQDHMKQHISYKTITELDNKVVPVVLIKGEKLTCTICHKQFDVFDNLKQHIYDEHITNLDCVVCSKTSTRRSVLNQHILEQHCNIKIINCNLCSQQFFCKRIFEDHMNQQHSCDKVGAIAKLDNEIGADIDLDNKLDAVTKLDNEIGADTDLDNKFDAVTKVDNEIGAELNKLGAITKLDNEIAAATELDNKFGAIIKPEQKFNAVIEPEEIFIKEESHYSDEYYSSDEEYEADNYEIRKDFSNFAMAEESNSRTSNSYDLEESVGSSVIPTSSATTAASYCEPGAPVDQSDVCDICQKMFLYLSNLSEHLNAHMQESSCSMCKDSAENISRLQRHMLTPCGNTNTPQDSASAADTRTNDEVTCVVCQQKFIFIILKKHIHTHITNLTCVVCNRTFTQRRILGRHLLDHCKVKPLQCEVCRKRYRSKEGLKYHMNTAHSSQVCQHCQKTIKNRKTLREHIRKQHPQNTYRCKVCKRSFLGKYELKKHAKLHTSS